MNQGLFLSIAAGLCSAVSFFPTPKIRWARTTPSRIQTKLKQRLQPELTGIDAQHYLLVTGAIGAIAVILSHAILDSWLLSLLFGAIGIPIAERLVMIKKRRQKERFEEGNIRALRVMASSLRTNPSYIRGFEAVVDSLFVPALVRNEYQHVLKLLRGQVPLETALQEMHNRTNSSDISYLYTILLVQKELGGDMARTLDSAASTILRRKQTQRKQKAALSQLLSQVNLLTVMPFVFVTALVVNNPHHFDPLTESLGGRLLILGAFLTILGGGELIRYLALRPMNNQGGVPK
ncbi:type II secretion system F family protein [Brevibacillus ginsengisoli]|uniref:type II secretion system F family protein n=1 Tax=Brevibacillus ginsengisoli TaxID=363854 RepID=UPI003CEAB2DA